MRGEKNFLFGIKNCATFWKQNRKNLANSQTHEVFDQHC